jgi:hypothetical protein
MLRYPTVLSETFKTMMVETQEALSKRDGKRHMALPPSSASPHRLKRSKLRMDATAKMLAEENRIMFADLSIMVPRLNAMVREETRAIIRERDA